MDTSKAAAVLGRIGGKAGRGEAKRRGDSTYYRAIRAKVRKPQVYARDGQWGGYTVKEGREGWIVSTWSAVQGTRSGWRVRVDYSPVWPRETDLAAPVSDYPTAGANAESILDHAERAIRDRVESWETSVRGVKILSRGHVVR